jgi:dTDP-3-amino-2,3,6-trideoxy-4-keto-D-glucose/dTDP-3-amino-3,4,6-trideoxy-alpha-D-glucose/dTDP-2,6-dideoxy-D-kanosamine transaminase
MMNPNDVADRQLQAIPAFDYLEGLNTRREEILSAIARVIDSGSLILGPEVAAFEREFAQFVGANYAIATSSGTDSLIIGLRSKGIGYGDEVITVANGPVPTIAAICAVGATPRFVDIDPVTLQINHALVRTAVTPATRCVIPIHLYGYPAPIEQIASICADVGVELIEDCAQAHGTLASGRHVGKFGAMGCFSFYPTKNLGAFGDAGMVVTNDEASAAALREQACYGFRGDRIAHSQGLNCRLDELQAACLRVQLKYLPLALAKREAIARRYFDLLSGLGLVLPAWPTNGSAGWHLFVIRVKSRAQWIDWLAQRQIQVGVHYATPVHLMPAYRHFSTGEGSLPVTEQACREVISLPMFPELDDARITRVAEAVIAGYRAGLR